MVFSSVPVYLDPPNWQHQQSNDHHQQHGSTRDDHHQNNPHVAPQPLAPPTASGGAGAIRPGSMSDRARLAKMPQPEAQLKCPRCESTNTKFCYFNNYSLTQPRHFCKTCRRYWTRGGALRNVPVGGGCRRNKRSKSSSSKSPVTAERQAGSSSSTTSSIPSTSTSSTHDIISQMAHHTSQHSQLPFMASLHHHLSEFSSAADHHQLGLNFGGINQQTDHGGVSSTPTSHHGGINNVLSQLQQVQQFPFLAGLDQSPQGLYPFDGDQGGIESNNNSFSGILGRVNGANKQLAIGSSSSSLPIMMNGNNIGQVKMEESHHHHHHHHQGLSLPIRPFLGIHNQAGSEQYNLGGNIAWTTDLSGFSTTPSSTSHHHQLL
ncbi:hypothetical protein Syun_002644 [Stephania yunnanensis]|uniref:Dof zinc finger protein n=1 Tax=Stephania yunnanensis TaxID=152371 RepID=A0AAP0LK28_9MAGN